MEFVIQPLESGVGIIEFNHNTGTNTGCTVNTVQECGCVHNTVPGCGAPKKTG